MFDLKVEESSTGEFSRLIIDTGALTLLEQSPGIIQRYERHLEKL